MWVRIPLIEKRKEKPFWCLGLIIRRNHHGVISLGLVCYCIHKKILCISCWRYNFFIVCVLLFVIWFPIGVHDLIPLFFFTGLYSETKFVWLFFGPGIFRFFYSQTRFLMNSPACLSAAPRKVLFGLLLNDVYIICIPLFSLKRFCGVMFSLLISAFHSCNVLASLKSKVKRNKMTTAGEAIEYRCLIRATDGKKTISTSVCFFWSLILIASPSVL